MQTVPVDQTRELAGQLAARGYPSEWIASHTLIKNFGVWLAEQTDVPADLHARVQWLHTTYAYRDATPDDGIQPGKIKMTRQRARDAGFHPLPRVTTGQRQREADERAFVPGFDRNGNFAPRYLPGHQYEKDDSLCGSLRDALGLMLNTSKNRDAIIAETGVYEAQLNRLRGRLGLRLDMDPVDGRAYRLTEDCPGAIKRAQAIWRALNEADDVTFACLQQGVAVPSDVQEEAKYVPHIAKHHPAVRAYKVWLQDERDRQIAEAMNPNHTLAA